MERFYSSAGTLRTCPYSEDPAIIQFEQRIGEAKDFDRSQCPHASDCTVETCPLCSYLNRY